MGINGIAVVDEQVISPAVAAVTERSVNINLTDAGEVRRLGRILVSFLNVPSTGRGTATDAFARDLIAALGFTEANTAKS